MPRARSPGDSSAMRANAPRTLNAPVRWNSSAFSHTPSPSEAQLMTGVRRTCRSMTPAARRTSSIVTGRPVIAITLLLLERARDDLLHDLVRAGVDRLDTRVQESAGDRVLEHVAVAAEQLQALVDVPPLLIGQPPLRHRGGGRVERAVDDTRDAVVDEHAADRRRGVCLGELEARVLEGHQRLAERVPCLRMRD